MKKADEKIEIPGYVSAENVLFSASSYFIDRIIPEPEKIILPPVEVGGGQLEFYVQYSAITEARNIKKYSKFFSSVVNLWKPLDINDGYVLDMRYQAPNNWAHSLNSHIPLCIYLRARVREMTGGDLFTVVLDERSPGFIENLYKYFEFNVVKSNQSVRGNIIRYSVSPWSSIRCVARSWLEKFYFSAFKGGGAPSNYSSLPKNIFISRRKTRALNNEREVEEYLGGRGFVKVYPEDMSVADQIALFNCADFIVAVHGAALGPLLYRSPEFSALKIIELLSPGHMTKYYRVMADQVGAEWTGVRGRIEKKHVGAAYKLSEKYRKYSLDDFSIDTDSLEQAFLSLESR